LNCGSSGYCRRDCFKLKNDKRKEIRVDSIDDVAAIVENNSNFVNCVLSVIENLSFDGWIMDFSCLFHAT